MSVLLLLLLHTALAADLLVYGDIVYPVSGPPIENGVVWVHDGRVESVTATASPLVLPTDAKELRGKVVWPGLIDGLSVAGMSGMQNNASDQDHREDGTASQPALRALDGYHPQDDLVAWLRGLGITTLHVGPSPHLPVGGRTLITKTREAEVGDVALEPDAMISFTLGERAKGEAASSRMGVAATIRQALADAADYAQRRALPLPDQAPRDLGLEALSEALEGKRKVVFYAHRRDDLLTAIRIAEEHRLDAILAGATEAWLIADRIAQADVPVLIGPVMDRSWRPDEHRHANFEAASILADAGVTIGFHGGYESYVPKVRVVLWEAAIAAANGLRANRARRALTLDAALILGIDDRVGSIEPGKSADLVVFDGDPLEITSHVCAVVIDGLVVSETCR
jgi:imidazolonepropionase-like amidohydrolase